MFRNNSKVGVGMSPIFGVGAYAGHYAQRYKGTNVKIVGLSFDCNTDTCQYDTDDGKHWLSDGNFKYSLEVMVSLVDARIYWTPGNGFYYEPLVWSQAQTDWIYGEKQKVPIAENKD